MSVIIILTAHQYSTRAPHVKPNFHYDEVSRVAKSNATQESSTSMQLLNIKKAFCCYMRNEATK